MKRMTSDARTAYHHGWTASKRTTTYDLDAASDRYRARYGDDNLSAYERGWTDYAADYEYKP